MAIRRINVGKEAKSSNKCKNLKPFKTLTMFTNVEELREKANKLISKKHEVIVNEKLLRIQYR